jgi:hypothetical protein
MPEAKSKSLDEAMLDTLGKAEEQANETGEQETQEETAPEAEPEQPQEEQPAGEEAKEEGQPEVAAKPAAKGGGRPAAGKAATAEAAGKQAPKAGTPLGWPPELHGEFYKLPRPVKNQILKQQGEIARERATYQKKAKEYAETAKRLNGFQAALDPFLPSLKALGVQPEAAIGELLQAHHVLRHGSKAERAQLVAGLVQNFEVDLGALASAIKGEAPAGEDTPRTAAPPPRPEQFRDPRIDAMVANARRVKAEQERAKQRADEESKQQHLLELQQFAASGEAPYFDAVFPQMHAVQAAADETGEVLSLKEVYERACYLNPKVRTLLAEEETQRTATEAKRAQQARTAQAQRAASSVKTEPGAPAGARKGSLDEELQRLASRYGG